jgi:site-specific DNA-methyltransferase (adenine-specific)
MIKLYNDDCFNVFTKIQKEIKIEEDKIDCICVDLPYGQTACKWDSIIDLDKMWIELKKICKKDCIYIFFCTTKFGVSIINSNPKWFKYDLVWEKTKSVGFLNANKQPLRSHEMIYIFYNKRRTYNPQKTPGEPYGGRKDRIDKGIYGEYKKIANGNESGYRHPKSIQLFKSIIKTKHPTEKPIEALEWLIKSYTNEGDLVMDFTMGSGTCGLACNNLKRDFIGVELEEEYFKLCENKINKKILIINK